MADYRPLSPVTVTAAVDTTGHNGANYTNAFTNAAGLPTVGVYEIYHAVITGGPPLAVANIFLAGKQWDWVQLGVNGGNAWDPSQPAEVRGEQELYFYWNVTAAGNPAPVVTLWPRYDTQLPENAY